MLSCCTFAQADLNIFVSHSWQFCRSKHRHSLMNNGNSDQSACGMIDGKKMRIMFAFAGLTLTPRAQVYLFMRGTKNEYY